MEERNGRKERREGERGREGGGEGGGGGRVGGGVSGVGDDKINKYVGIYVIHAKSERQIQNHSITVDGESFG